MTIIIQHEIAYLPNQRDFFWLPRDNHLFANGRFGIPDETTIDEISAELQKHEIELPAKMRDLRPRS